MHLLWWNYRTCGAFICVYLTKKSLVAFWTWSYLNLIFSKFRPHKLGTNKFNSFKKKKLIHSYFGITLWGTALRSWFLWSQSNSYLFLILFSSKQIDNNKFRSFLFHIIFAVKSPIRLNWGTPLNNPYPFLFHAIIGVNVLDIKGSYIMLAKKKIIKI